MSEPTLSDLKQTARAYEDLLVPALFEPWAEKMAALSEPVPGEKVADVACGTGVLARTMAGRVGPGGSVTGLDPNPGMLAVAAEKNPDIEWREARAEAIPVDDGAFDLVVSQFGLMLFEEPEKALREMCRVLRQGGRTFVAVFDSLGAMPAYAAAADVYEEIVGPSVGDALRFPFSMGDPGELEALFERAGISNTVVTTHGSSARFDNVRHMVLSDVKGWFPFAGIHLDDDTIERVEERMGSRLSNYIGPDGHVRFDVSIHVVQGFRAR